MCYQNIYLASLISLTRMGKKHKKKPQTTWGKIWHFIWHDDSLLSWGVNIVLAFIIIKFLVYPFLSLIFGTSLPVVAVISCSMDHGFTDCGQKAPDNLCGTIDGTAKNFDEYWTYCGDWYENKGISYDEFKDFPLNRGFDKGDVIVLRGTQPENVEVGDVLVFMSGRAYPIIHRVVGVDESQGEYVFETKGDHNPNQITDPGLDETNIKSEVVLGEGFFRIPYVGYVKILAVDTINFIIGR